MLIEIGRVEAIFRYPVKSMGGERLEVAKLKAVVRANQNNGGIYGVVTRIDRLAVGQTILLRAATETC